jgi:capsular exopolysaccharide synthesis family protein
LEPIIHAPVLGTLPLIETGENLILSSGGSKLALTSRTSDAGMKGSPQSAQPQPSHNRDENISPATQVVSKASFQSNLLLESCRFVRTNLTFSSVDNPLRSILVTSADAGEGKSFCARNLASVIAYDGKRVILVDCDLRRPVQHRHNGLPLTPGFTNVLLEPDLLDKALHQTNIAGLRILTAGAVPPNPPELLGSDHCHNLMVELQKHCDLLIIDSPPASSLTDAQVLSSMVDGVILVVGADSTSSHQIRHAQSNIRQAGGRLLGAIFNKTKPHNDPYGYHGYYKYGSYHYYHDEGKEDTVGARS